MKMKANIIFISDVPLREKSEKPHQKKSASAARRLHRYDLSHGSGRRESRTEITGTAYFLFCRGF